MARLEALAQERFSAPSRHEVQREAAQDRSDRGHQRVVQQQVLVPRDHEDDQEVVDFGEGEKRGIEKTDQQKPGAAVGKCEALDPSHETLHQLKSTTYLAKCGRCRASERCCRVVGATRERATRPA
jgi:hypothetical protein